MMCILIDIIIPLGSALIGGVLTLGGVFLTMTDQHKKDEIARKASARPWIYSCVESNPKLVYTMASKNPISPDLYIVGEIKNTDNGLMLLECVKSEKVTYYPDGCNVVDKNTTFKLVVYLENKIETLRDIKLYIKDIYGNGYCYEMICTGEKFVLGKCEEVKTCQTST